MPSDRVPSVNGFTLVEVLVALVVTGLLLGIVVNAAAEAKQRSRRAEEKSAAILLARDLLARAAVRPPQPGASSGAEGILGWKLTESVAVADPARRYALVELEVTVSATGERPLLRAATRKLKRVAPQ